LPRAASGFARSAGAARKSRRRIAPQRLGQCGVEIVSRDAQVGQPMVLGIAEVRELTPMFDGDDDLSDVEQGGGDGLADQCESPGTCSHSRRDGRTHGALLSVALDGHDLGHGALCGDSL
jgi:hypothetical protein